MVTSASQCHSSISCTSLMDPRPTEGPTKSLSVCLSVFLSFQHFSQDWFISSFHIFFSMVYSWKNGKKSPFFQKIHFCPNLGRKGPKWPQNRVFQIFWKILSLVFPGNNLKLKLILLLIFTTNSTSGKILILQLWAKMLLASQLAAFFKI